MTLKQPAPLDTDLRIERHGEQASLWAGETLLATAELGAIALGVPEPPTLDEARAAEQRFRPQRHLYPGCFVGGPDRAVGDGWRIFPGPVGPGRVAASWTPAAEFAGADGLVRPEFVWAALDCPGYFAVEEAAGLALLGRIGARIERPVPAGGPLIVTGWAIGSEGRKHRAGTALYDADGQLLASADQLWISLR